MTDHDALAALLRDHAERAWPAQLAAIENGGGWNRWDHAAHFLEAAGVRVTGDAGLDVERLARALASALGDDPTSLRKLPLAELIAREYAALTGDTPEALPLGEPAMHAHDGLGTHRAEQHHRPEDYR